MGVRQGVVLIGGAVKGLGLLLREIKQPQGRQHKKDAGVKLRCGQKIHTLH